MVFMFAAGATGVMLGLRFRVQVLITASAATVALWLIIAPFAEYGLLPTIGMTVLLLGLLQAGYLAGLMIQHVWSRATRGSYEHLLAAARALYCGARTR